MQALREQYTTEATLLGVEGKQDACDLGPDRYLWCDPGPAWVQDKKIQ